MMTEHGRERLNRVGGSIAVGLTILLGFAIAALVFVEVPEKNQNALLVLIGAITTNVTAITAFFFGASSGQRKDSETINTLAATAAKAQDALAPVPGAAQTIPVAPGEHVVVEGKQEKPA